MQQHELARRDAETSRSLWILIIWGVGLLPLIVTPFWPRSFDLASYAYAVQGGFGEARTVPRLATAAIILIGFSLIVVSMHGRPRTNSNVRSLWLGAILLGLGPVLSMFLGTSPQLSLAHLALPLVFTAIVLLPKVEVTWYVKQVIALASVYVLGSVLVAMLAPGWALERPYAQAYVPALNVRLHGVTVHAATTAVFPWLLILFAVGFKSVGGNLRVPLITIATIVLVLNQSKATLALLLIGLAAIWLMHSTSKALRVLLSVAVLILLVLSIVAARSLLTGASQGASATEGLVTLTGRVFIWAIVLQVAADNPLFGYGPHLWDAEMTARYARTLAWVPAQAHNQYLQSLGEAGIVGVTGLFLYGFALLRVGWHLREKGRGLTFVLPLLWLLRGITEAWYARSTADGNLVAHMLIFGFLVTAARDRPEVPPVRRP